MRITKGIIIFFTIILGLIYFFPVSSKENKNIFKDEDRDPFSPLVTKSGQLMIKRPIGPRGFIVKGIIYSEGSSVAIIGDEVFKENDIINDYKVVKIGRKKVILKKGKELLILKLEDDNEKLSGK